MVNVLSVLSDISSISDSCLVCWDVADARREVGTDRSGVEVMNAWGGVYTVGRVEHYCIANHSSFRY